MVEPRWKTVWRFLKTLKIALPFAPAISLLGIYSEELKWGSCRDTSTRCSLEHSSQQARCGNNLSVHGWMDKGNPAICHSMPRGQQEAPMTLLLASTSPCPIPPHPFSIWEPECENLLKTQIWWPSCHKRNKLKWLPIALKTNYQNFPSVGKKFKYMLILFNLFDFMCLSTKKHIQAYVVSESRIGDRPSGGLTVVAKSQTLSLDSLSPYPALAC